MPNHVSTKIEIQVQNDNYAKYHETRNAVIALMKSDESDFDFNNLIPMPTELIGTRSPANIVLESDYEAVHAQEVERYKQDPDFPPAYSITAEMSEDLIERFGTDNWYAWSVKNWGTKWGAYEVSMDFGGGFRFQTAWRFPTPIMAELSKRFPDTVFLVEYADEDYGSNCAITKWCNGVEISRLDPDTME